MRTKGIIMAFLSCFFLNLGISAQEVSSDRLEDCGVHHVSCKDKRICMWSGTSVWDQTGMTFHFAIDAYDYDGSNDWILSVGTDHFMPPCSELAMKFRDGTILCLKPYKTYVSKKGVGKGIILGENLSYTKPSCYDWFTISFKLTDGDIQKIASDRLSRLRLSDGVVFFNTKANAPKFRRYIRKSVRKIKRRFGYPYRKKRIQDEL